MASYLLPVNSLPNQSFTTTLQVGGKNVALKFSLNWNLCTNTWELSAFRGKEQVLNHIPIVVGRDILNYKAHLGLGNLSVINDSNTDSDRPNLENLGSEYLLLWETPDETVA